MMCTQRQSGYLKCARKRTKCCLQESAKLADFHCRLKELKQGRLVMRTNLQINIRVSCINIYLRSCQRKYCSWCLWSLESERIRSGPKNVCPHVHMHVNGYAREWICTWMDMHVNEHKTEGGRSFAVPSARLWNNVLLNARKSDSFKVHLFKRIFPAQQH